jgi:hypothetical protein
MRGRLDTARAQREAALAMLPHRLDTGHQLAEQVSWLAETSLRTVFPGRSEQA